MLFFACKRGGNPDSACNLRSLVCPQAAAIHTSWSCTRECGEIVSIGRPRVVSIPWQIRARLVVAVPECLELTGESVSTGSAP